MALYAIFLKETPESPVLASSSSGRPDGVIESYGSSVTKCVELELPSDFVEKRSEELIKLYTKECLEFDAVVKYFSASYCYWASDEHPRYITGMIEKNISVTLKKYGIALSSVKRRKEALLPLEERKALEEKRVKKRALLKAKRDAEALPYRIKHAFKRLSKKLEENKRKTLELQKRLVNKAAERAELEVQLEHVVTTAKRNNIKL